MTVAFKALVFFQCRHSFCPFAPMNRVLLEYRSWRVDYFEGLFFRGHKPYFTALLRTVLTDNPNAAAVCVSLWSFAAKASLNNCACILSHSSDFGCGGAGLCLRSNFIAQVSHINS